MGPTILLYTLPIVATHSAQYARHHSKPVITAHPWAYIAIAPYVGCNSDRDCASIHPGSQILPGAGEIAGFAPTQVVVLNGSAQARGLSRISAKRRLDKERTHRTDLP